VAAFEAVGVVEQTVVEVAFVAVEQTVAEVVEVLY